MTKKYLLLLSIVLWGALGLNAQVLEPVKWSFSLNRISETQVEVVADATIDDNWHLYSTKIPDGGPVPTSLNIAASELFTLVGEVQQSPEPEPFFDEAFQMELGYFSNTARLTQVVELAEGQALALSGYVEFMVCDDHRCLPPERIDFELSEDGAEAAAVATDAEEAEEGGDAAVSVAEGETRSDSKGGSSDKSGYWGIFWLAFLGGLAALLTPCVFPMIPLTVSFFLRNADNRGKALRDGLFYGLTIIFAYVFLGLAISVLFGADALNAMATSPVFNVIFFALLIFFAASFFGAFELTMPSKWSNSLDNKADKAGGLLGVFLMGLTFVLVSFSCTGPIVGTLLVEAAIGGGSMFSPAIGMLGFSVALAIPFALFAIFPTAMKSLPKSGGWMNAIKVVLGFVVLAFSLKFLSVADSVGQWGLLDREVFIVLWIAIFFLMGLYLIGKIKFAHDSDLPYLSVPRLMLSIATFAFVFYLIPGLWGAPLKAVSSFIPSITTQDFDVSRSSGAMVAPSGSSSLTGESLKEGPYGLMKYTDYEEGLAVAKETGKPVFLDFTGLGCANCRKMENLVWSDHTVRDMLANAFIIVSLYVDNREELPEEEQYVSEVTGRRVRTIGNKWSDFQISRYENNSQPFYVLLNHNEEALIEPYGYNTDVDAFVDWMKSGLSAFK
ncbi:protein-disulfide reductase DsbD family protein [Geofilum rubicundum]|uniref:Cytochrome c-type biogenesis protein DsbD, protein-disulfide reductase n=1 Tax=Geofilum rubicundum JCM 15548 TaxID=1236989 RepID=A0A0E9M1R0_9BACT|nr:cytochrome c biogenesis protein CcdA [Geofilum rubicundum]GAO31100.1 cytochrome c-type biogenesis protein DsbD, protein-disulfide reductase [Geofilum rubicundum JCM 15548]